MKKLTQISLFCLVWLLMTISQSYSCDKLASSNKEKENSQEEKSKKRTISSEIQDEKTKKMNSSKSDKINYQSPFMRDGFIGIGGR